MLKGNNVMIDVETAGNQPFAAPIAIGAVEFSADGVGRKFDIHVDLQDALNEGCTVTASTLDWWMTQPETWLRLREDAVPLSYALSELAVWLPDDPVMWARGADFEFGLVLRPAFDLVGMQMPWRFRNHRCMRTLEIDYTHPEGAHDPVIDAIAQAEAVIEYFQTP